MRDGLIRLEIKCLFYLLLLIFFFLMYICVKIVRSDGVLEIMGEKAARSQGV